MDAICKRCGRAIGTDRKGQWADIDTLSYRCLQVGEKHIPNDPYRESLEQIISDFPELSSYLPQSDARRQKSDNPNRIMGEHINS